MPLSSGTKLGSYQILASVGAGGMGEVYRARDSRLERDVAIKILPEHIATEADAQQRFARESKALAALSHPNIVSIFDFGAESGTVYAVMELLEGETLRQRLQRGPLSATKAAEIAMCIADGLAAAHSKGIVHRDLKPENIFLTREGRVKILDFGLARMRQSVSDEAPTMDYGTNRTSPGTVLGTTGYMAPEQVRGHGTDGRTDIFALGCVLYEMVTGRRAFRRDSGADTMAAILNEEPPAMADSGRLVPPALEGIVHHCLEKNPEERFQSARDLAFALRSATSGGTSSQTTLVSAPGKRPAVRARTALAAVVLVAAASASGFFYGRGRSPQKNYWKLPVAAPRAVLTIPGDIRSAAISPDGTQVAFVLKNDLYIQGIAGGDPRRLTTDGRPKFVPRFSPDGDRIIYGRVRSAAAVDFVAPEDLYVVDVVAGAPRLLVEDASKGVWSPDGKRLAFVRASKQEAFVADANGSNALSIGKAGTFGFVPGIAWSPDGKQLAVVEPGLKLFLVSAESKARRQLEGVKAVDAIFTPDGKYLIVNGPSPGRWALWQVPVDGGKLVPFSMVPFDSVSPTMSRDGSKIMALLLRGESNLAQSEVAGNAAPSQLTFAEGDEFSALSPDGKSVAFSRGAIWVMDVSGRNVRRITDREEGPSHVAWTPDGTRILYARRNGASDNQICVLRLDEGRCRPLDTVVGWKESPTMTADGNNIVFWLPRGENKGDLWMVPTGGGQGKALTNHGIAGHGRAAPVGNLLAYVKWEASPELRLLDLATGFDRLLIGPYDLSRWGSLRREASPRWSKDGKYVFVLTDQAVLRISASVGEVQKFAAPIVPGDYGFAFDVTPDQRKIIFTQQSSFVQPWIYSAME